MLERLTTIIDDDPVHSGRKFEINKPNYKHNVESAIQALLDDVFIK